MEIKEKNTRILCIEIDFYIDRQLHQISKTIG